MRTLFRVMRFLHWEWPCTCGADPYCRCAVSLGLLRDSLGLPRVTPRRLCASRSPVPVAIARKRSKPILR